MRKLEQEPETYDSKFTELTDGVNIEVQDWILERIGSSKSILEIGCGTGSLASKMALNRNDVQAVDINFQMINFAMQNYPTELKEGKLLYQIGSFADLPAKENSQDSIVSTFLLSELRPFEQQIFLRNAWKALKPNGTLYVAAEFIPNGIWKLFFKIKRWWYRKKLRRLRLSGTYLIKWFFNYLEAIGFKIAELERWKHGSIQAIKLTKIINDENEPGFYQPEPKKFKGIRSQFRIFRCLFTGQIDSVPIEPGVYKVGNPSNTSPLLVSCNYEYTYIKLMRDIKNLNAWVLCVDSNGINVWCAARGNDFGNKQLIEAVEATGIQHITDKRIMILPQLSAGGVAIPELPTKSDNFPFKVKYGPVWSKDLPEYVDKNSIKKPDNMKLAKFTLSHRIRGGITHTTFLFRKIFIIPLIIILVVFLSLTWFNKLWWIGELALWIILANVIISLLFPISKFTRKFIIKGVFFGILNVILIGFLIWFIHGRIFYVLGSIGLIFWISFFSTMSFSGYSMATSPREIQTEYTLFRLLNTIFLVMGFTFSALSIFFY